MFRLAKTGDKGTPGTLHMKFRGKIRQKIKAENNHHGAGVQGRMGLMDDVWEGDGYHPLFQAHFLA